MFFFILAFQFVNSSSSGSCGKYNPGIRFFFFHLFAFGFLVVFVSLISFFAGNWLLPFIIWNGDLHLRRWAETWKPLIWMNECCKIDWNLIEIRRSMENIYEKKEFVRKVILCYCSEWEKGKRKTFCVSVSIEICLRIIKQQWKINRKRKKKKFQIINSFVTM